MRLLLPLVAVACALVVGVSEARPASGIVYGIQDDAWLEYGPGTLAARAATLDRLGVDVVRVTLNWNRIEPARGTYQWGRADALLRALSNRGLAPVVTLWGTPSWANDGFGPNVAPSDPADVESFAREAALRYPFVRYWVVWNEPNKVTWLKPVSAQTYVTKILNPAYRGIKSASPRARVAGGVTAPRGGQFGMSALSFLRRMAAAGARLDAYAHNPYPLSPGETPRLARCSCSALTMANLNRLTTEVGRAFPRARIWLTEYGYQTRPPDPFGVSFADQARYYSEAARRTFSAPKVDMLIHYLYRDEPDLARWQSGLETIDGRAKPARAAAMLPLAQVTRQGARTKIWGQVRPGTGRQVYVVQRFRGGRWQSVGVRRLTSARGFFTVAVTAPRHTRVRVVAPALRLTSPLLKIR